MDVWRDTTLSKKDIQLEETHSCTESISFTTVTYDSCKNTAGVICCIHHGTMRDVGQRAEAGDTLLNVPHHEGD